MSLLNRFNEDLKGAMKASEGAKVSVLRMIKSEVKNRQIDKGRELTDEEIMEVLSRMAKKSRESIEQFANAGRTDLVKKEEQELSVLQSYMPRQMSHEEIDRLIHEAIAEASARNAQDMGRVMRVLMPKVKGVADGKYVNQRAKELLEKGG